MNGTSVRQDSAWLVGVLAADLSHPIVPGPIRTEDDISSLDTLRASNELLESAKEDVLKMTVEQVVSSAGDGNLRDAAPCSDEFRQFLNVAPIERLFDYARHCLESSFNKS